MNIKLRARLLGAHVHADVFMGADADHYKLTGRLVMDVEEWRRFAASLHLATHFIIDQEVETEQDPELGPTPAMIVEMIREALQDAVTKGESKTHIGEPGEAE